MSNLPAVQLAMEAGRRAASYAVGQIYSVYRLNENSTGSIIQPSNLVYDTFPALRYDVPTANNTETNVIVKVPRYEFICDAQKLQLGDVIVEKGSAWRSDEMKPFDGNCFTFAYYRPLQQMVFVWTPVMAQLSRDNNNPLGVENGITPIAAAGKPTEEVLVLINGLYDWASSGTPIPAAIPMGIVTVHRGGGKMPEPNFRLPTDVPREQFDIWCPNLPGVVIGENMIVTGSQGDRYTIVHPYAQVVGMVGQQFIAGKTRV